MHALPVAWNPVEGTAFTWSAAGNFCSPGDTNTCEQFLIAKIFSVTDTEIDLLLVRNVSGYWACPAPGQPQIDGGNGAKPNSKCVNSASQNDLPNGWMGNLMPGVLAPEEVYRVQIADNGSATFVSQSGELSGHTTAGIGTDGALALIGYDQAFHNITFTDLNQPYYAYRLPTYPQQRQHKWGTTTNSGWSQSYLKAEGYRPDSVYRGVAVDSHHLANGGGGTNFDDFPRTITAVSGMTNVYKYTGGFSGNYKEQPLIMVAGNHLFKDRSGPGCNLATAPNYTLCFLYRSGTTAGVTGEAVGDLYFKAPYIYGASPLGNLDWADPIALFPGPTDGGLRQYPWELADTEGRWNRFLGYTGLPGQAPGYSEPGLSAFGNKYLHSTASWWQNYALAPLFLDLPNNNRYIIDWSKFAAPSHKNGSTRNYNLKVDVPAMAGATYARMRFGLDPQGHCTESSEACYTDEVHNTIGDPFAFAGESLTPTACASGCSLYPPVTTGWLYWIQAEYLNDAGVIVGRGPLRTAGVN